MSMLALGLTGVRHIPLACVAAVPLIADAFARDNRWKAPRAKQSWKPTLAVAGVVGAILIGLWRFPMDVRSRYLAAEPVRGARALAALDRPMNVFTTYSTGSFVLFTDPDDLKVFVDSRADVYGDAILRQSFRLTNAEDWEPLFESWHIDAAVVRRSDPLAAVLRVHADWELLAEDPSALTFVKPARTTALSGL